MRPTELELEKLPHVFRCEPDPGRPGTFLLVDEFSNVWARGIPSAAAAQIFGAAPALLRGFGGLLEEAYACFQLRFNLEHYAPDFGEFFYDNGELEEQFPGAPELARWLHAQSNLHDDVLEAISEAIA